MRLQRIVSSLLWLLSSLLLFILIFENKVALPAWLQVAGRMHPLMLHFPVVLVIIYAIWVLLVPKNAMEPAVKTLVGDWILLSAAFTALVTALMGVFLSHEPGYDPDAIAWHKWSGVVVAFILVAWYFLRESTRVSRWLPAVFSLSSLAIIVFTGHQGAGITHGQNFLLAPILPEKNEKNVSLENAIVFTDIIQPILDEKCMSCHNSKKAKGELIMETKDRLLKGGKSGALWDSTEADLGLLLRRIHLSLEQKKHMPPQGKPQLTDDEVQILYYWIKSGADFEKKVLDYPVQDSLRLLSEARLNKSEVASYDFEPASEKTIKELNNVNRVIYPLAIESPALGVNFYNKEFFNSNELKALLKVKEQVVSLDCSHMPVKDEDLSTISQLVNLRHLLLNFTSITGKTLSELKKLPHLKTLAVAGTPVTKDQVLQLENFPSLEHVYVWNSGLSQSELEALKTQKGKIVFETGVRTDTLILKLTPPVFENELLVFHEPINLKLKHYINGTEMRYTTDGSEPDSLTSPIYDKSVQIAKNTTIRSRAFKKGWISSDVSQKTFLRSTFVPDSIELVTPPDPKYNSGTKLLADNEIGDLSFGNKKALGYRNNKMEVLLYYASPITAQNVTVSFLKSPGSYIMPPVLVEIWGGDAPSSLKLLGKITPKQPEKMEGGEMLPLEINFSPTTLKCIRVIAHPVSKLPLWHPGKGDKGWVFCDEIMVN